MVAWHAAVDASQKGAGRFCLPPSPNSWELLALMVIEYGYGLSNRKGKMSTGNQMNTVLKQFCFEYVCFACLMPNDSNLQGGGSTAINGLTNQSICQCILLTPEVAMHPSVLFYSV